jgi:RNA polymerase-binding transcription factor DksA
VAGTDLRARLEQERADLREQADALQQQFDGIVEGAELVATDDEHDPEGHTIAYERQQVAALLRDVRLRLAGVDGALDRVAAGTYGRCVDCGEAIGAERLEVLPGAERCIDCAR